MILYILLNLLVGFMLLFWLGRLMVSFCFFFFFLFRLFILFLWDLFWYPANIKLYVFESSVVISLLDFSTILKVVDHFLQKSVLLDSLTVTHQADKTFRSGNSNVHSSVVIQKPNLANRVGSHHTDNYAFLFSSLKTIDSRDFYFVLWFLCFEFFS